MHGPDAERRSSSRARGLSNAKGNVQDERTRGWCDRRVRRRDTESEADDLIGHMGLRQYAVRLVFVGVIVVQVVVEIRKQRAVALERHSAQTRRRTKRAGARGGL